MSAINMLPIKVPAQALGASTSFGSQFSADFESALNFRADIVCSSVTVTTGITAKVQIDPAATNNYVDLASGNASVSITADGVFSIKLNIQRAADQADLPLAKPCRILITTGAGDAVTIDKIYIQQR